MLLRFNKLPIFLIARELLNLVFTGNDLCYNTTYWVFRHG